VIQRRLDFLTAFRFGRYVLNEFASRASCEGFHSLGRILVLAKSLKTKSVIQRRLDFLKAVRFGRYVLSGLVRWASCQGLHRLGRIFVFRYILKHIHNSCHLFHVIQFFDRIVENYGAGILGFQVKIKRVCKIEKTKIQHFLGSFDLRRQKSSKLFLDCA